MHAELKDIILFDRELIRRNRERSAKHFADHDFLFQWTIRELSDRLNDINRTFENVLHIGSRGKVPYHPKIKCLFTLDITQKPITPCANYIQGTEEFLPFADHSFDLILSTLNLHMVNDLPGTLIQIRRVLKPDGLFLAAMLGGETLHELRQSLTHAEMSISGGLSPRIAPFADKPQMGDLLQRAGFSLPVVDSEILTVTYPHIFKLMHDLRGMGEGNAILARQKTYARKSLFLEAARFYQEQFSDNHDRIMASFEIIFLLGWSPHDSQQKPLRPGSAKSRLADALGTNETSTGEKATP